MGLFKQIHAQLDRIEAEAGRVNAERDQLRQQVERLLDRIEDVKRTGLPPGHPQSARSKLFEAADRVRRELGE
jgi:hypothetical protein